MGASSKSIFLFKALLRSPSVKIPFRLEFSITKATPSPLELISIRVLARLSVGKTIGNSSPFFITSSALSINLFPSLPPG